MEQTKEITIEVLEERYQEAVRRLAGLEITSDDDYYQAAVFARAVAASERELSETEEVKEKERLYRLYKGFSGRESAIAKKLKEVKDILRAHLASYAVRRGKEALDEATEKALAAAIATGDESYLDLVVMQEVAAPQAEGITFAKVVDYTIDDPAALPREYLVPDQKLIRKVVQARGLDTSIPGVTVRTRVQVRVSP